MTAGLLEVEETLEHLEPGDDVTCDTTKCEQAAKWWITCRRCRNRTAVCDLCRIRAEVFYVMVGGPECVRCGLRGPSLRAITEITPIGGAS